MNTEEYLTMDHFSLIFSFSLIFPTLVSAEEEYYAQGNFSYTEEEYDYAVDNSTWNSTTYFCYPSRFLSQKVIPGIIIAVSICGLLGNGTVVWLLGFRMKGNLFTTYILNLAVADFAVLILSLILAIRTIVHPPGLYGWYHLVKNLLFYFAYSISQFLLTTISIDRCVSVLFSLWYRFRRPKKLSAVVCAVIWILSFLVQGISLAIDKTYEKVFFSLDLLLYSPHRFIVILMNSVVCLTIITVSTLILFAKFCFKSQQRKRGRLLTAIFLTLVFFLIFAFPINVIYLIWNNPMGSSEDMTNTLCYYVFEFSLLCASLNSFVNPLLYFLVGRKKRGLCGENLKLILQRVFIEEEEAHREEPGIQL